MKIPNLARDTILNMLGSILPLLVGLITIPYLLNNLGKESFGILTIMWAIVGYFGLFDLGVGRALVYQVSVRSLNNCKKDIDIALQSGLVLTLLTGTFGAILIAFLLAPNAHSLFSIVQSSEIEVFYSFIWIAFATIPTTISSGLRGAAEGLKYFGKSSSNRAIVGSSLFLFPALSILIIENISIVHIGASIFIARVIGSMHIFLCLINFFKTLHKISYELMVTLIKYGGWASASGVIGPIMIYGDRFILASIIGVANIAAYSIAQEINTKALVIPSAFSNAILPRLARSFDSEELKKKYMGGLKTIFKMMFPISFVIFITSPYMLSIWIGPEIADEISLIMQILVIGLFIGSFGQISLAGLYSISKPKIVAAVHFFELLFYLIFLYYLSKYYGLFGAALCWTIRVIIDSAVLHALYLRELKRLNYGN